MARKMNDVAASDWRPWVSETRAEGWSFGARANGLTIGVSGGTKLQKRAIGLLSLCAVVLSATILSIPIAGILGIVGNAQAAPSQLRIGFMQKVDSLNPYVGLNDAAYIYYGLVYDSMNVIDNQMNPFPDLALGIWALPTTDENMTGLPYGSVWQYNLTRNAVFHDGEPVTAEDVVWNVNLNCKNYDSMWAYQPYSYFMKEAVKIDDYTVRIYFWDKGTGLGAPASYAYLLSLPILPKHLLEGLSAFDIGFNWTGVFSKAESPNSPIVGTGPFMGTKNIYQEWITGNKITLKKNPLFHWKLDKGPQYEVKFDQLVMKFYDDSTAMTYGLENGEIDVAAFPPQAYRSIKADVAAGRAKNITTFDGPKITQYWTEIGFSMDPEGGKNPSRLDPVVRQALAIATNKTYIVENYYLGLADEATTVIPPINTYWHYEPTAAQKDKFKFNLTRAEEMLTLAGYKRPSPGAIRVCTSDSLAVQKGWVSEGKPLVYEMLLRREYPEERDIAQYLEGQWAQIGVDINYIILDEAAMSTRVYTYNYDSMIWYWSSDIDPNYQLFCISSYSWFGWNDNKYDNKAYDENYTNSVNTVDRTQRKVFVDNCQNISYEDCAYILLAYVRQTYAWRDDTFSGWGNWTTDPGRSVDNFWMGNPLYFDLVYIGKKGDGGIDPLMIAIAVAVIAAVVVAAVLLMRRGRKKEGSLKEGGSPLGD